MTTLELIKIRNECYNGADCENDFDCPFNYLNECRESLAKRLADRLEKAYGDIIKDCYSCKHYDTDNLCAYHTLCVMRDDDRVWKWRGDDE